MFVAPRVWWNTQIAKRLVTAMQGVHVLVQGGAVPERRGTLREGAVYEGTRWIGAATAL